MRLHVKLINQDTKVYACRRIMQAEFGQVVTIQDPTRKLAQNALLHRLLTDIRDQCQYMGKPRTIEFWKGLLVSGWQIATGQHPEIVPGLEGEFVNIRESTATMSGKRLSSVIEYIQAWAAQEGVRFTTSEYEDV